MSGETPGYKPEDVFEGTSKLITDAEIARIGATKENKKVDQGRIADHFDIATNEYTMGRSNQEMLDEARDEAGNTAMGKEIYMRAYEDFISQGEPKSRAKLFAEDARQAFLKRASKKK